jgi:hypothetical protein
MVAHGRGNTSNAGSFKPNPRALKIVGHPTFIRLIPLTVMLQRNIKGG